MGRRMKSLSEPIGKPIGRRAVSGRTRELRVRADGPVELTCAIFAMVICAEGVERSKQFTIKGCYARAEELGVLGRWRPGQVTCAANRHMRHPAGPPECANELHIGTWHGTNRCSWSQAYSVGH